MNESYRTTAMGRVAVRNGTLFISVPKAALAPLGGERVVVEAGPDVFRLRPDDLGWKPWQSTSHRVTFSVAVSEGEGNGVFTYWHDGGCLCFAPPPGFHATPAYANQTLARQGKVRKANAIRLARGTQPPRPPVKKPGERTCQRCRKPFTPPHKHIFRCRECKRATAWMG